MTSFKDKYYRWADTMRQRFKYGDTSFNEKRIAGKYTDVIDTEFTAIRIASEESARYALEHMRTVNNFETDYDLHYWVANSQLDKVLLDKGMVLEFGVATGRSLNHFARWLPEKTIYGFDSFEGLPEDWTSRMKAGHFARSNLPSVRENCELIVGWFDNTIPPFKKTLGDRPIALLHVDGDLYSSAKTVLNELKDNIVPGTVIVFDEYMNYPGWQQDEFRAWKEFFQANYIDYEYIGRVSRHQQVALRILNKS